MIIKCVCIWVREHKKTKSLLQKLKENKSMIVRFKKENDTYVFLLPVQLWHTIERFVDSAGSKVSIQALYTRIEPRELLIEEEVSVLKDASLKILGDKVKCNKIDEYNAVKRQIEFDQPKELLDNE